MRNLAVAVIALGVLNGCQPRFVGVTSENLVELGPQTERTIGDGRVQFEVVSRDTLASRGVDTDHTSSPSLIVGFPKKLIGQTLLFGGAIVKVSDRDDLSIGGLKLSQLEPAWVITRVDNEYDKATHTYTDYLDIDRCQGACGSDPDFTERIARLKIIKQKNAKASSVVYLDPTTLDDSMDLVQSLADHFKTTLTTRKLPNAVSNATIQADFSNDTLAVDIQSNRMIPANQVLSRPEKRFSVTSRWFFKLATSNGKFPQREANASVGFFAANANSIQRFDLSADDQNKRIKYYIKNVPFNRRQAFASAFENWNTTFQSLIGHPVFDYEFISDLESSPAVRKIVVTGDPRFNVVEWDLDNKAGYGGFGPTTADPVTGEILSANVLVQGPVIEKLYAKWFQSAVPLPTPSNRLSEVIQPGLRGLNLRVPVLSGEFMDPFDAQLDFYQIPAGVGLDEYMNGYFTALVTHELGHNLGLRHNFKGSLGANAQTVSRSVMDYLSGEFRHRNAIGEYDVMALAYGYLGQVPPHSDWYCTDSDESGADNLDRSAECTSKDATQDPFGNDERLLVTNVEKLAVPQSGRVKKIDDIGDELEQVLVAMAVYAASAQTHAHEWTNFYQGGRPHDPAEIQTYVIGKIVAVACSAGARLKVEGLANGETKSVAQANLRSLEQMVHRVVEPAVEKFDPDFATLSACRQLED